MQNEEFWVDNIDFPGLDAENWNYGVWEAKQAIFQKQLYS